MSLQCETCGQPSDEISIARGADVSFEKMCFYLPFVTKLLGVEHHFINLIPVIFSEKNGEGTNILVVIDDEGTHIIKLDLLDKEMETPLVH